MLETSNSSDNYNYYCSIFTDAAVKREDLVLMLGETLDASPDRHYLSDEKGEIGILENKSFDDALRKDETDGFLHYRFLLETEPNDKLGQENAVTFVSKILNHLWSQGFPAVASCDYEELLPNNGGYKSQNVPRPQ